MQAPLDRTSLLFAFLLAFFVANSLIAEVVGIKIFALDETFGYAPFSFSLFGQKLSLHFTAGVILWPFVFTLTDVLNDYFGRRGVRIASLITAGLIVYAFLMIFAAIALTPAQWWLATGEQFGLPNMQVAFAAIYGQGMWIIGGSLVAFLLAQFIDAFVFSSIKKWTGDRWIWLRATLSTIVGQLLDSFVVLYIAFVLGPQQWSTELFISVGTVNFIYKLILAVLMIPILYGIHYAIAKWLGEENATDLRRAALRQN